MILYHTSHCAKWDFAQSESENTLGDIGEFGARGLVVNRAGKVPHRVFNDSLCAKSIF